MAKRVYKKHFRAVYNGEWETSHNSRCGLSRRFEENPHLTLVKDANEVTCPDCLRLIKSDNEVLYNELKFAFKANMITQEIYEKWWGRFITEDVMDA